MRPSLALAEHRTAIRDIMASHGIRTARVFGSSLHGDDEEGSDLDLLVEPASKLSLFQLARLRSDLQRLLGVEVDVVTPGFLPEKMRDAILQEAEPV